MNQLDRSLVKPIFTTMSVSEAATMAFGARLSSLLQAGDIVRLEGNLGVGKTCFARGLIHSLCGAAEEVPSPTFSLVQTYEPAGAPPIWHFDLYRLERPEEVYELGIEDALDTGICLIEWSEKAENIVPLQGLCIEIGFDRRHHRGDAPEGEARPAGRVIQLYAFDEAMANRVKALLEMDQQ